MSTTEIIIVSDSDDDDSNECDISWSRAMATSSAATHSPRPQNACSVASFLQRSPQIKASPMPAAGTVLPVKPLVSPSMSISLVPIVDCSKGPTTAKQSPPSPLAAAAAIPPLPQENMVHKILELCRRLAAGDNDDLQIIANMEKKMDKCNPSYTNSPIFTVFANKVYQAIVKDPLKRHVHLKELFFEMTAFKIAEGKKQQQQQQQQESMEMPPPDDESGTSTSTDARTSLNLRRLEKMYRAIEKKIASLEARELSFDDLDDDQNAYIRLDKYKRRSIAIWQKICQLTGREAVSGRLIDKKYVYNGARYEIINKKIMQLVNKKKFPDFHEVHRVVTSCNQDHSLHLRSSVIEQIAENAFEDIGKELKRRRIADYEEHYGCPCPVNSDEDPANENAELRNQCSKHKEIGKAKLDEIFSSFARKQVDNETSGVVEEEEKASEDDDDDDEEEDEGGAHTLKKECIEDDDAKTSMVAVEIDAKYKPSESQLPTTNYVNMLVWDPRGAAMKPVRRPLGHVLPTLKRSLTPPLRSEFYTPVKRLCMRPVTTTSSSSASSAKASIGYDVIVLD